MVESQSSVTPAMLEEWARGAFKNRLRLHLQAADPVKDVREQTFLLMSEALQEAIKMVRVAAVALREQTEQSVRWEEAVPAS